MRDGCAAGWPDDCDPTRPEVGPEGDPVTLTGHRATPAQRIGRTADVVDTVFAWMVQALLWTAMTAAAVWVPATALTTRTPPWATYVVGAALCLVVGLGLALAAAVAARWALAAHQRVQNRHGRREGDPRGPCPSTCKALIWASILEDNTRDQRAHGWRRCRSSTRTSLSCPTRTGKGATVGSVIPTDGAIIPAAVGVDIGCGMIAVRTQFTASELPGGPLGRCARRSSGPSRCRAGAAQQQSVARAHRRRGSRELRELAGRGRASTPRSCSADWRLQLGHARLRQPLHRGQPRRARPGVAVPALRLARRRQQDRPAPHQGRPELCERW